MSGGGAGPPAPVAIPLPTRPGDAPATLRHRPLIDGFRGLMILITVAYHLGGTTELAGGWVGVSGFLVLSGFLITSLLLAEGEGRGRISLRRFFARRLRRLAPALLVTLALTLVAARLLGGGAVSDLRAAALSALFYVANWHFIASDQSYFTSFNPSPLRHTWSLAIEEQFYLLWPLVVMGLLPLVRRRRAVVVGGLLVAAAGSAWWMRHLVATGADLSRAYYGTDTRAQELLVGAALAVATGRLAPTPRLGRVASWVGTAGLAGFAAVMVLQSAGSATTYTGGGFTLTAVLAALVVFGCARAESGPLGLVFGSRAVRALGHRSYCLYLVHWPVIVLLSPSRVGWSPAVLDGARVAVSLALTEVIHRTVERPIHRRGWALPHPGPVLATSVAAVALLAATTGPATTLPRPPGDGRGVVVAADTRGPLPSDAPGPGPEPGGPPADQPGPAPVPGDRLVVLGDSQAWVLLEHRPDDSPFLVSGGFHAHCDIVGDQIYLGDHVDRASAGCADWPDTWRRALVDGADAVVVALGLRQLFDPVVDGERLPVGSPGWEAAYRAGVARAVGLIRDQTDAPVVWLDVPCYRWDAGGRRAAEAADPERLRVVNAVLADALGDDATVVPYRERVCRGRDAHLTDDALRPDGAHLTAEAAAEVWRWLEGEVRSAQAAARATGDGSGSGARPFPR